MILFDTHAHIDFEDFDADRDEMIGRARAAGVVNIVNVGFELDSSRRALRMSEKYDLVYAAVGVHPHAAGETAADYLEQLEKLAAHPKVVALGEMGLDYFRNLSPVPEQKKVFRGQLALARRLDLPVVIHDREAHGDMMDILRNDGPFPAGGVIHCYSGSWEMARECMAMGFYISIAGPVTFPKSARLKDVAARVPLDRLLVETDAPYLTPVPHRGKRNEPAYVGFTLTEIAALKKMEADELAKICVENGRRLFRLEECPHL
ncbi:TatD family hydrolase [Pelotomaculum terephthalicicum JT]|uniref:TatD family hydrolase n=1 Tax=Pelotomaculum TaxID=191373 RepID=UPI0009D24F8E|nr:MULTISPECIES: TatD family hydrolase [Pelotomaculum]MCG9968774.1 TatD family hydrolase [Pelotomaculum terephthalicicum JT]OPX84631.1 MAG: putative deoxyribonuclease YcfH [Pelotomaculum sp. PtaB.Bin117]OPY63326.1 MAG: putative deoxyribonuclease YcfH [Pelotomaculum sp. PtaU1.Bin065]